MKGQEELGRRCSHIVHKWEDGKRPEERNRH